MGRIGKQELGRIWETGADETKEMGRIRELGRILRRKKEAAGTGFRNWGGVSTSKERDGEDFGIGEVKM